MADHIRIRHAAGTWVVRTQDAVLGESSSALELQEGDSPAVIYFPRADVAMALLDRSDKVTHCPHKGDATHFTIVTPSGKLENAAWSYEATIEAVSQIEGHIAFYDQGDLTVENL